MKNHAPVLNPIAPSPAANAWLDVVRQQVNSLKFGVVQIVVHDSQVVQIERTEKVRLDRRPETSRADQNAGGQ
jgi:hypothetical protein